MGILLVILIRITIFHVVLIPPSSSSAVVKGYAQQQITHVRFSKFRAGATLRFIIHHLTARHEYDVDVCAVRGQFLVHQQRLHQILFCLSLCFDDNWFFLVCPLFLLNGFCIFFHLSFFLLVYIFQHIIHRPSLGTGAGLYLAILLGYTPLWLRVFIYFHLDFIPTHFHLIYTLNV